MGNPLSPLLAEIFMNNLEDIISKHPLFKKCIYWHRYVDDILVCFNGTYRQIDTFLQYLNTVHPNIKFTMELESNNSINFLDLTLKKFNNRHQFSIYHKPSQTDITIHSSFFHPYQYIKSNQIKSNKSLFQMYNLKYIYMYYKHTNEMTSHKCSQTFVKKTKK